MSAANAFRAKAMTFGGAKTGIQSIKVKNGGTAADLTTDASPSVNAIFVDMLVCDVTVALSDFTGVTSLNPGDTGALTISYEKRAEGRGAAGSGTPIVATFSNAVVIDSDFDASTTGIGNATVTWRCSNPSGGSCVSWA